MAATLLSKENECAALYHYWGTQPDIQPHMRMVLFDWLMELSEEFMLKRDTYYAACNFVDRVLQMKRVTKAEFQLVGVASLLLACKVEEVSVLRVSDFALSTDGGYAECQVVRMERDIASTLTWKLHPVTASTWANWLTA